MGLGPRVAIMGAITEKGWLGARTQNLKSSLSVLRIGKIHSYKSIKYWQVQKDNEQRPDGEGYNNINASVFKEYFQNNVIPFLEPNSVIILDNARYHRTYRLDTFKPTASIKKEKLREYISSQGEESSADMKKPELLKLAKFCFKKEKTEIQQIAENNGHTVLYLPPYHPELNPIEFAWGFIKAKAAANPSYSINTINKQTLPEAFATLSQNTISKFFSHVRKQESIYMETIIKDESLQEGSMIEDYISENDLSSIYESSASSELTDLSHISDGTSEEEDN